MRRITRKFTSCLIGFHFKPGPAFAVSPFSNPSIQTLVPKVNQSSARVPLDGLSRQDRTSLSPNKMF